jgi:multidrug efflux pump subunit AcrB
VKAELPGVQAQLPPELKMDILIDQSKFVQAAVDGVLREGAIAAGLTALMILLFLGSWRSTIIVAISIPLSILVSVTALWALGQTINTLTLGGMALAVGILVDDATVEIENVHRQMGLNKPLRRAILDGAAQIAVPAFVSTLCICIVFLPVFFLSGPAAYLFAPLAMSVIFAMLTSYLLSRTLVPTMVLYLLPPEMALYQTEHAGASGTQPGSGAPQGHHTPPDVNLIWRIHRRFDVGFEWFRSRYQVVLETALANRGLTVGLMLAFALGSFALLPFVGEDFFPAVDAGQIRLHVRGPDGIRIEETEKLFGRVENVIREVVPDSERDIILDNMGLTSSFTAIAYTDNGTVSDSDGEILVSLKEDHRPTAEYVARLREELPRRFPGCTFYFEPADITGQILNAGLPAPINVQVVGVDREKNLAVAKKLRARIAKVPGAADVYIQQMTDAPELRVRVDRILASELDLTQNDVTTSMLVSLSSTTQLSPNYWVNPVNRVNYRVAVQTPPYRIDSIDTLMNTPIVRPGRPPQLLSNLADLRRATTSLNISHYNVQTVYEVNANTQGRDLGSVVADVQRAVDAVTPELPRGSKIVVRGQAESMNTSFTGLAYGLAFAVLLVYLLMVVNFQSWIDPFVILTALPGAGAGILWALFVTQTTLSVPALMGAIMCVGVATSNSILLITFANDRRKEGADAHTAARDAGSTRLRPVLMTAAAMIIGMLPMSLGLGEGGEQNAPLGRAVIGGLLVATFFTLLFVPVAYSLLRTRPPEPEVTDADLDRDAQPEHPTKGN